MRHAAILVAVLVSTRLTSIAAQETLPVKVGDRVRITATDLGRREGTVQLLTTDSLVMQPDPAPPRWKMFLPMASSKGRYFSKAAASPPTMMVIPGGRPLTGASSTSMPWLRHTSATSQNTVGELVVMSM